MYLCEPSILLHRHRYDDETGPMTDHHSVQKIIQQAEKSSIKKTLLNNFLRYIAIDTQSDPQSITSPSTRSQFILARMLAKELKKLGLTGVSVDDHSYVMATLPANTEKEMPVMGFIAHLDTSPDMSGKNIHPQIHEDYDGKDIILNRGKGMVMRVKDFPELQKYRGQTLITTDGTSLLGADNKAGIAEIMTALHILTDNPSIRRPTIKIAFTPDEEIGKGADHFDVEKFGADYAYTIDGGELGELQYENFNAAHAKITISGVNIHPGEARGKMVNACLTGMQLNSMLPAADRPENTSGYEGFYHLISFQGNVEKATMQYIIRDHNLKLFEQKKAHLRHIAGLLNQEIGNGKIVLEIKDQYYNMDSKIYPVIHIVERAKKAMESLGIHPLIRPIRGGTDGARLSAVGLPCPNIFCGGHNYHGPYEFIPLESMEKATLVILKIIEMAD